MRRIGGGSHIDSRKSIVCGAATVVVLTTAGLIVGAAEQAAQPPAAPPPAARPPAVPPASPAAQPAVPTTWPAGQGPKFRCDELSYTFPDAWSGDKIEHTYIVHNDGKTALHILNVRPTCGCTLTGAYDKVIEPGQTGKIPIALSTVNQRGMVAKTIHVETNDPENARVTLTIRGNVNQRISIDPPGGGNWGRYSPQTPATKKLKLTNNMPTPLKLEVAPDQPESIFIPAINEIEPGKVYEIDITLRRPFREGQNAAQLRFKTGLADQPELTIPCSLFMPAAVEVIPTSIVATTSPTQEYKQLILVRYNGEGSMKILSVEPSDSAIKTQVEEKEAGKVYNIPTVFPPGFQTAPTAGTQIVIKTDVKDKETITIPVRVRSTVTAESMIGKPAPVVKLKTPEGQDVQAGGTGKVQLVNFWTTWCPHCKKQLPMLERVLKDYASKGVELLSISVGPRQNKPEEVAATAKTLNLTTPVAVDSIDVSQAASPKYYATGFPTLFVLGKTGVIEAVHRGDGGTPQGQEALEKTIRAELDALLEGKDRTAFKKPEAPTVASATQPATPPQKGPALVIDMLKQDIGLQKPDATVPVAYHIRNPGTEPVTVKVTSPSEGLKISEDYPKTLAPGAAAEIRAEFKTPKQPGEFAHKFVVESNDPARKSQQVQLTGKVKPYLEVMPPAGVTFSRNTRTHSIPSLATLVYNGPDDTSITYSTPKSSSEKFEATVEPIPNGPYAKLIVKAKPPFEVGEHKAVLHIETTSKEQPSIDVPVSLFMPHRVEVTPPEVVVPPSQRLQRSIVTIRNNGEDSLSVLGVTSSSKRLHWQFYPDQDGMSYRLMLTIPPQADFQPGPDGEKITIRTDDPQFKEIVIPVKLGAADNQGAVSQVRQR